MPGYTRDQIYAAMRAADKAGDAEAVRALAAQLKQMDQPEDISPENALKGLKAGAASLKRRTAGMSPEQRQQAYDAYAKNPRVIALKKKADELPQTPFEVMQNVAVGAMKPVDNLATWLSKIPVVGPAVNDLGEALGLPRSDVAAAQNDKIRRAEQNRGFPQKAEQFVGNMIGAAPVAALPGGVAAQSGVAGAVLSDDPNDMKGVARDTVVSAVLGKGLDAGAGAIGRRAAAKRATAQEAVVPEAQDIVETGGKEGVRVLTTDLKPPQTFMGKTAQAMGERIPIAGTGGVRAAQQSERVQAVKNLLQDYGGEEAASVFDDPANGMLQDVAKSLTTQRANELSRLAGAKKAVIDKLGGAVPVPGAVQAIDEQIARLQSIGMPELGPVITKLEGWKAALGQGKSLRQIEEIRKVMGQAFDDPGLAGVKDTGQKAVNAIYGPLRDDMGAFIAKAGTRGDYMTWARTNKALSDMAGELDSSAFRNALKNAELTPEAIGKLLFSKNPSDVARLYKSLDPKGQARARAAVLQRAFDKAISADGGLSVERLVNNLDSLGSQIGIVFQGDDLARVQGMAKLLNATRRAASASAAPPTGVQNTPILGGFALGSVFGSGAIPVAALGGLFARAYESAPVRNALLRLGKAKAGTVAESKLAKRAVELISATSAAKTIAKAANENAPTAAVASGQEEQQQPGQ